MSRRRSTILMTASLMLFTSTIFLWILSYARPRYVGEYPHWVVAWGDGQFGFGRSRGIWVTDVRDIDKMHAYWRFAGIMYLYGGPPHGVSSPINATTIPVHFEPFEWTEWWLVGFSFWWPLTLSSLFPAVVLCKRVREMRCRRLAATGRCANCGYDLRATPSLCPECGATSRTTS